MGENTVAEMNIRNAERVNNTKKELEELREYPDANIQLE